MKKIFLLILMTGGFFLAAQAGGEELLIEAQDAFAEGRYGEAANIYQEAAVRGLVKGELYYNQGNSWFLAGETYQALLSYLKAETLKPGDGDIKKNLSFLRARSGEDLTRESGGEFLRVLFFWHFDLSLRLRGIFFLIVNVIFWVLAVIWMIRRKGRVLPGAVLLSGTALLALLLSMTIDYRNLELHPAGVILKETVARKGDGDSFEEAFNRPLQGGTEFVLEEARGDWYHIRLSDGTDGWIVSGRAGLVQFP